MRSSLADCDFPDRRLLIAMAILQYLKRLQVHAALPFRGRWEEPDIIGPQCWWNDRRWALSMYQMSKGYRRWRRQC
jgi:hypothetical protein